jgi:hypothetical protein
MPLLTPRQKRQRRAKHGPNQQSLRLCLPRDALRLRGAEKFHVKCGLEGINSRETCSVNNNLLGATITLLRIITALHEKPDSHGIR